MMPTPALSVSDLNDLIRDWIEACPPIQDIWINGEIKNFRRYASGGHLYFTLSDAVSTIQCVAFDVTASRLKTPFKDGMHVMARGKVRYFNRKGSIQFQITYMMPQGAGDLALNLALLKQTLTAEGLFDSGRKRPLPLYPSRVAIITAPDSAAEADVIRLLSQYAPAIQLTRIPATVQGMGCVPSIIAALDWANQAGYFDIILVARGGGSAEDLLPFSDDQLVRAIAASAVPVAVAIGHETDETFADLVADQSFPTPSAAAIGIAQALFSLPDRLDALTAHLTATVVAKHALAAQQHATLTATLTEKITAQFDQISLRFDRQLRELDLLSPLRKLQQGFSISRLKNMGIVSSISAVSLSDLLVTRVQNGVITSRITDIQPL